MANHIPNEMWLEKKVNHRHGLPRALNLRFAFHLPSQHTLLGQYQRLCAADKYHLANTRGHETTQQLNHSVFCSKVPSGKALQPSLVKGFSWLAKAGLIKNIEAKIKILSDFMGLQIR